MKNVILQTNVEGFNPKRGKVRDIYDLGNKLLIVATDRISAFDVVMANGIPYKGIVLTRISKFWFDFLGTSFEHHLITDDVKKFPDHSAITPTSLPAEVCLSKRQTSCR